MVKKEGEQGEDFHLSLLAPARLVTRAFECVEPFVDRMEPSSHVVESSGHDERSAMAVIRCRRCGRRFGRRRLHFGRRRCRGRRGPGFASRTLGTDLAFGTLRALRTDLALDAPWSLLAAIASAGGVAREDERHEGDRDQDPRGPLRRVLAPGPLGTLRPVLAVRPRRTLGSVGALRALRTDGAGVALVALLAGGGVLAGLALLAPALLREVRILGQCRGDVIHLTPGQSWPLGLGGGFVCEAERCFDLAVGDLGDLHSVQEGDDGLGRRLVLAQDEGHPAPRVVGVLVRDDGYRDDVLALGRRLHHEPQQLFRDVTLQGTEEDTLRIPRPFRSLRVRHFVPSFLLQTRSTRDPSRAAWTCFVGSLSSLI